jgi:hypothetical protein
LKLFKTELVSTLAALEFILLPVEHCLEELNELKEGFRCGLDIAMLLQQHLFRGLVHSLEAVRHEVNDILSYRYGG